MGQSTLLTTRLSELAGLILAGQLRLEQSPLPNHPIHLPHHCLNLVINALDTFLPAGIGPQLRFPSLSSQFIDGSFSLIAKPDL